MTLFTAPAMIGRHGERQIFSPDAPNSTEQWLLVGFDDLPDGGTTISNEGAYTTNLNIAAPAQVDTSVKRMGTGSLRLDGLSAYVSWPSTGFLDMGTEDHTHEMWVMFDPDADLGLSHTFMSRYQATSNNRSYIWRYDGSVGQMRYGISTDGSNFSQYGHAWAPTRGVWTHVAAVRLSNTILLFVDGQLLGAPLATSQNPANPNVPWRIGAFDSGGLTGFLHGWVDEARVVKGTALYTANFDPHTVKHKRLA